MRVAFQRYTDTLANVWIKHIKQLITFEQPVTKLCNRSLRLCLYEFEFGANLGAKL